MNAWPDHLTPLDLHLSWQNDFAQLGEAFFTRVAPQPMPDPYWVVQNTQLGQPLGLPQCCWSDERWLQAMAGNRPLRGSDPLASVYSGHQFGSWAGQLGDGRAVLLGQVAGLEVQLKGCGLTPYSRMGDGRAVLRSSIREYLACIALQALNVPSTDALCVVGSDLPVRRECWESAAVITRLAPSFIRFGHFEHFAATGQHQELRQLADFVIARHYPACLQSHEPYAELLRQVTLRTAQLIAHWQSIGFCHGVLNTDNMSILGLSLDFGPFAFMDAYQPDLVCNRTDHTGRYAFSRQPVIAFWNLHALAHALQPLINNEAKLMDAVGLFREAFDQALDQRMGTKLGLTATASDNALQADTHKLWLDLLPLLSTDAVDYPIFWRRLSHAVGNGDFQPVQALFAHVKNWRNWLLRYQELLSHTPEGAAADLMLKTNPAYVLRTHLAENVIRAAQQHDFTPLLRLQQVLQTPFVEQPDAADLSGFAPDWAADIQLTCSS